VAINGPRRSLVFSKWRTWCPTRASRTPAGWPPAPWDRAAPRGPQGGEVGAHPPPLLQGDQAPFLQGGRRVLIDPAPPHDERSDRVTQVPHLQIRVDSSEARILLPAVPFADPRPTSDRLGWAPPAPSRKCPSSLSLCLRLPTSQWGKDNGSPMRDILNFFMGPVPFHTPKHTGFEIYVPLDPARQQRHHTVAPQARP